MFHAIGGLLDDRALARVRALVDAAPWQDGRATAGEAAATVKANAQIPPEAPEARAIATEILAAFAVHEVAAAAALVRRFGPVMASRTEAGGGYGGHVDEPLMRAQQGRGEVRTDLAFTLFLTDPDAYQGGALLIETEAGTQAVKLPAGAVVIYPASFVHAVETVTHGTRLVVVGWIESLVADAAQRAVLFELATLRAEQRGDAALRLARVHGMLLRMWARP
jgi:PKHD-type hydroxylase